MLGTSAYAAAPYASLAGGDKTVALTGVAASGAAGSVSVVSSIPLISGWGSGSWGSGSWGSTSTSAIGDSGTVVPSSTVAESGDQAYGNTGSVESAIFVDISGLSASGDVGSVEVSRTLELTGDEAQGFAGTVTGVASQSISGVDASGAIDSLGVNTFVALTEGWGASTWGYGVWGGYSMAVAASTGDVVPSGSTPETGDQAYGNVGSVEAVVSVSLSGIDASGAVDSLGVESYVPLSEGWGVGYWGSGAWGTSSIAITGSAGNVTTDATTGITGVDSTGDVDSVGVNVFVPLVSSWGIGAWGDGSWGGPATAGIGSIGSVVPSGNAGETGDQAYGNVGNIEANVAVSISGIDASGAVNSIGVQFDVPLVDGWGSGAWGSGVWGGESMSATGSVGSVGYDRNNTLSGTAADGLAGTAVANITVSINGGWGLGPWNTGSWGVTPDSNQTWGQDAWGANPWGGLTGGVVAEVGSVVPNYLFEIQGDFANAAPGSVTKGPRTVSLSGVSARGLVNKVYPKYWSIIVDAEDAGWQLIPTTSGWGGGTWGQGTWGGQFVTPWSTIVDETPAGWQNIINLPAWGYGTWGQGLWGGSSTTTWSNIETEEDPNWELVEAE